MGKHLFGLVVTPFGAAANNRGETEGNITTLQKVLWNDEVHTTVSAEAIRWALRWYWQRVKGEDDLNRCWDEQAGSHRWSDPEFKNWAKEKGKKPLDDDVLGFMSARAAKEEGGEGSRRGRGTCDKRRARLEVTRAISLTPFAGDITFNAASVGATPSASKTGRDPVPYGTEVHATRYQYGFALTPEELHDKNRALDVVDAIVNLSEVAGNQARFLFDFSPDTVIFRWTDDFAPRMLYGFEASNRDALSVPGILQRVEAGDIDPHELVVGGTLEGTPNGEALKDKGAFAEAGVKSAAEEVKRRIKGDLKLKG